MRKFSIIAIVFCAFVGSFLIAMPFAQAYSVTMTHYYGNSAGQVAPAYGSNTLFDGYVEVQDGLGGNSFNDEFSFDGFSDVESFTLTLNVSDFDDFENWYVRPGGLGGEYFLFFLRNDVGFGQFKIDNGQVSFTLTRDNIGEELFNDMVANNKFYWWFAEETFSSDTFKLYDATLTINGTEAESPVPIPGAAWLLGSGLVGLMGIKRRFKKA